MRSLLLKALRFAVLAAAFAGSPAYAQVQIDVNKPNVQPMPIAITNFAGVTGQEGQIGKDMAGVIAADLERSGLFKPIDQRAFIQTVESLQVQPRFPDWKAIGAQALVQGRIEQTQDGHLRVEFRLWDVFAENQMIGQAYNAAPQGWRRIAHMISDAIYKRITGEDGYFDTQIVYVAESGPQQKRIKRLAIMDQDSENHRFLTDGQELVLTPRFSPNQREITYLSYFQNNPRVYILHLDSGRRELLGDFPGMTFAPRFSPDGNKVVMSLAQDGNTNIYEMDLRTRHSTRLTTTAAIDTSPSYSPDGAKITFNSDRGGSPQLYVMNSDGSGQQRVSFGDGRYMTPVWSPRGDLIAFTKQKGNEFYIGVMHPDGSGERLLTRGYLVEAPTWAPNGRVLAFWRQTPSDSSGRGGTVKLYSIDLTGNNERQIVTPLDGSDPAWSPLIP
ncbi:Tol-Pal system beta propeller repeat protein TolB [Telmatospirillum siberiense]|uniref:Tol-Pal system protein TolB n=1 Tax=Telmatospirillum siberiense TaxID=382514 RepID=A0A2N3Q1A0_9PROT|nr:Tol-Pal system beta propeller repeat protein TolB [Telmatospirillum siberiense]PKU26438.1 Tol-Pal system beta propeller repeat protein TolB [Telmatospirillum siberiense]